MTVGFVSFENAEQLKTAQEVCPVYCVSNECIKLAINKYAHGRFKISLLQELRDKSIGNKTLKVADVIPRSFEKKIRSTAALPLNGQQTGEPALDGENAGVSISSNGVEDGDTNNNEKDGSTVDGSVSRARSLRDVVTPLAHMPYSDQLEHKKNSLMQSLKRLVRITFSDHIFCL